MVPAIADSVAIMDKIIYYLPVVHIIVLIATAILLLCYTIATRSLREETHKLAEQSVLQTEIQIRPFLIVIFDKKMSCFIIENIGNGIALNIETEDIPIIPADTNGPKFSFEKIDVLPQGKKMIMLGRTSMGDQQLSEEPSHLGNLDPDHANCNYEFGLKYENINGKKYQYIVTTGKDGVHIKEICKV